MVANHEAGQESVHGSAGKKWWKTWWGHWVILIVTGVVAGLIMWGVTRHYYDQPAPSKAVEQRQRCVGGCRYNLASWIVVYENESSR
jgi:hypothetical protein